VLVKCKFEVNSLSEFKSNKAISQIKTTKNKLDIARRKDNTGFKKTSNFLEDITRKVCGRKGFSQSKILINWTEIVGRDIAEKAKPSKVIFSDKNQMATLILTIFGPYGPEIHAQNEIIKEKINQTYGYYAISKISLKQNLSSDSPNKNKRSLQDMNLVAEQELTERFDKLEAINKDNIDKIDDISLRLELEKMGKFLKEKIENNC